MWWSRLFCSACVLVAAGCGFSPVYAPGGPGSHLVGQIALPAPVDRNQQLFHERLQDRMGAGSGYWLNTTITTNTEGLGSTSDGSTTLYQLVGTADYALIDGATRSELLIGTTDAFSSYSASGSTVSTAAAERDATKRLMVILADQVIDALIMRWPEHPK
jgi:LPS-assembly lipoprotein